MLATAGVVVGVTVIALVNTAIRKRAEEAIRCQIRLRKGPVRSQAVDDHE